MPCWPRLLALFHAFTILVGLGFSASATERPPNIIFILADDFG